MGALLLFTLLVDTCMVGYLFRHYQELSREIHKKETESKLKVVEED